VKKKNSVATIFFILLGGFLSLLLISQIFVPSNFISRPTLGSVVPNPSSDISTIKNYINQLILGVSRNQSMNTFSLVQLPAPLVVNSSYYGSVLSTGNITLGASVIKEGNAYRMWYCGVNNNINVTDITNFALFVIYTTNSTDGFTWSQPQIALRPTANASDTFAACYPTVVKAVNTYFLYYTGIGWNFSANVFAAISNDGATWSKYPSNSNPKPIFQTTALGALASMGVVFSNSTFFHFYQNVSIDANSSGVYLATSSDGINYIHQNNGKSVFTAPVGFPGNVKFLNSIGNYFMVYGGPDTNKTFWTTSYDGISWLNHDFSRTIENSNTYNLIPTILGYPNGTSDSKTVVYYAAVYNDTYSTIEASLVNVSQNVAGSFNASGFKCNTIANGFNCNLNYINTYYDDAVVVFLFINSDGTVTNNVIPIAKHGISQLGALYLCSPGSENIRVSWKAYKVTDQNLSYPIAWVRTNETQLITCSGV